MDFESAKPLIKTSVALYFRANPKNSKGNKQRICKKYMRKNNNTCKEKVEES